MLDPEEIENGELVFMILDGLLPMQGARATWHYFDVDRTGERVHTFQAVNGFTVQAYRGLGEASDGWYLPRVDRANKVKLGRVTCLPVEMIGRDVW